MDNEKFKKQTKTLAIIGSALLILGLNYFATWYMSDKTLLTVIIVLFVVGFGLFTPVIYRLISKFTSKDENKK